MGHARQRCPPRTCEVVVAQEQELQGGEGAWGAPLRRQRAAQVLVVEEQRPGLRGACGVCGPTVVCRVTRAMTGSTRLLLERHAETVQAGKRAHSWRWLTGMGHVVPTWAYNQQPSPRNVCGTTLHRQGLWHLLSHPRRATLSLRYRLLCYPCKPTNLSAGKELAEPHCGGRVPLALLKDRRRKDSTGKAPGAPHSAGRVPYRAAE